MIIGGFQKNSLIDYPGKISCVIFLFNCNFQCPYCHNPGLVTGNQEVPCDLTLDGIISFLEQRKELLEGVVITGGEPTLYSGLTDLCIKIKKLGYDIKLDTNGSRPDVIKKLIHEDLIDYWAMDIKTVPAKYTPVISKPDISDKIHSAIDMIKTAAKRHEFRTTCVHPFINEEVIQTIARMIHGADCYVLQHFNHTRLLNPDFFNGLDPYINDIRINNFKAIAAPHVRKCLIR